MAAARGESRKRQVRCGRRGRPVQDSSLGFRKRAKDFPGPEFPYPRNPECGCHHEGHDECEAPAVEFPSGFSCPSWMKNRFRLHATSTHKFKWHEPIAGQPNPSGGPSIMRKFPIFHAPFPIPFSSFSIHHSPFQIHNSPFSILNSKFTILHSKTLLWVFGKGRKSYLTPSFCRVHITRTSSSFTCENAAQMRDTCQTNPHYSYATRRKGFVQIQNYRRATECNLPPL